jgi:16S rRNA processing protein RimM
VAIARVLAPHGIRGELKCAILTDFPRRFASTARVLLGPQHTPFAVERARVQGRFVLLKLDGLDSRNDAERWRNALVEVPQAERVRLPRGHYRWEDVLGLAVRTEEGEALGRVRDIIQTGANDVYVVDTEPGELLIPAIKDVVKRIDPANGEIVVQLMEGMR